MAGKKNREDRDIWEVAAEDIPAPILAGLPTAIGAYVGGRLGRKMARKSTIDAEKKAMTADHSVSDVVNKRNADILDKRSLRMMAGTAAGGVVGGIPAGLVIANTDPKFTKKRRK